MVVTKKKHKKLKKLNFLDILHNLLMTSISITSGFFCQPFSWPYRFPYFAICSLNFVTHFFPTLFILLFVLLDMPPSICGFHVLSAFLYLLVLIHLGLILYINTSFFLYSSINQFYLLPFQFSC